MKGAVLTIRVQAAVRARIERLAREEGRSLSSQTQRLLETALDAGRSRSGARQARPRRLAGVLAGGRVPTLADFRETRGLLSASLESRTGHDDNARR